MCPADNVICFWPDILFLLENSSMFIDYNYYYYQVSRYQKGKTNLDLLEQEIVCGSGISWAICKSAPCPRQIIMPAPHSDFYRPDTVPAAQPTAYSAKTRKALGQCKPLPMPSLRMDSLATVHESPKGSNRLFLVSLPIFPENFVKIWSDLSELSCGQKQRQITDKCCIKHNLFGRGNKQNLL